MAKKNKEDEFFSELANSTGGETLSEASKSDYHLDTGNLGLNFASSGKFITGGLPGGKIIEVYGPPASAKSLLGYTVLGSVQRMGGIAILLDCERAANPMFAESAGHVNTKKLVTYEPISIQEVERKIVAATKKIRQYKGKDIPILFVWDSIGVTPTEREFRETNLPEKFSKEEFKRIVGGNTQPGERAKACGDFLRKINPFLSENNATLFVINQTRQAIGVLYGSPEVTAGGGNALPFYASCRIRTSAHALIYGKSDKDKDKEDDGKKKKKKNSEMPLGVNLTFQNKKNRSFTPFVAVNEVQLYFKHGISPLGGLLGALLAAGRIEKSGKGYYKILEPWAGGEEIKFQSTEARNDVPADAILKCPAVIDADSEQQVRDYLEIYGAALNLSVSDTTEEKEITNEDMDVDLEALGKGDEDE